MLILSLLIDLGYLDSGVSSHMTSIKDKFISLHIFNQFSSVNIVDGTRSLVLGNKVVHATPSLNLTDVLYVPIFFITLLSISQFTKQNNIFPFLLCLSGPDNWEED